MKVSSLLNTLFVLAAMKTKFGVLASNVESEEQSHSDEHVIGHDSLNNKENILNIQDDFSVYENFQILTQEKTVYVTLNPTTVYVTVTKTVGTTTTVYPNTHVPIVLNSSVASYDSSSPTKKIVSSSVYVVTTETAVVTSLTTTTAIPATTTAVPSTTTIPTSIGEEESSPLNDFATTKGELDMILGDRQKYLELLNSTTTVETKKTIDAVVPETTFPAYGSVSSIVSQTESDTVSEYTSVPTLTAPFTLTTSTLPAEQTSSEYFLIETLSPASPLSSAVSSSESLPSTSSFSTSAAVSTSFSPVNNSIVNHNSTGTSNSAENATGLEQLLKNFSPYTDLPSADYEFSNGGNSVNALTVLQGLLTVMAAVLGALV